MSMNEADTRYHLIDPLLREKGYVSCERITLETVLTPAPVEPIGPKGRRRKGPGRTGYLLCVQATFRRLRAAIVPLDGLRFVSI